MELGQRQTWRASQIGTRVLETGASSCKEAAAGGADPSLWHQGSEKYLAQPGKKTGGGGLVRLSVSGSCSKGNQMDHRALKFSERE